MKVKRRIFEKKMNFSIKYKGHKRIFMKSRKIDTEKGNYFILFLFSIKITIINQ